MNKNIIQQASAADFCELERLEETIWKKRGVRILNSAFFEAWIKTNPSGFHIVTNQKGQTIAYGYYIRIFYSIFEKTNPRKLNFDIVSDHGFTTNAHKPDGDCFFGISLCSTGPGAGKVILENAMENAVRQKIPLALASRISGYARFLKQYPNSNIGDYLQKTSVGLRTQDKILNFYLAHGFVFEKILLDFMQDPESGNNAVLVKYKI